MKDYDNDFILKLIKKDKDSFSQFYVDNIDIFYRYLKSNYFIDEKDIEDLLSSFFIKLWNNFDKYSKWINFNARVWTVFKNFIFDFFKKKKENFISLVDSWENTDEIYSKNNYEDFDWIEILENEFNYNKIVESIEQLDEKSKEIIFLKYIEERTLEEISILLNINYDNVRQRLSRAIRKLKQILNQP